MDLTKKEEVLKYLKKNNLWAKKGLGQNFLINRNVLEKIIEAAELTTPAPLSSVSRGQAFDNERKGEVVVEVGPGIGTLTQELLKYANEVIAVEKDEKLSSLLISNFKFLISNQFPISNLEINKLNKNYELKINDFDLKLINSDILKLNLNEIIRDRDYKVVANIPYYITSKIIELFLSAEKKPELLVLLVQKEVAERICAKPGEMSTLSVSVQLYGKPEIIEIVPAKSFFPEPKVDSAILKIRNIHNPFLRLPSVAQDDTKVSEKSFFRCVHIGFASKRKTLVNNLSAGYRIAKKEASDIISSLNFNENIRAQELSVNDWKRLALKMDSILLTHK